MSSNNFQVPVTELCLRLIVYIRVSRATHLYRSRLKIKIATYPTFERRIKFRRIKVGITCNSTSLTRSPRYRRERTNNQAIGLSFRPIAYGMYARRLYLELRRDLLV